MNKIVRFDYYLARDADDTCTTLREWCNEQFGQCNSIRWYDDLFHGEAGFEKLEDANKFGDYIDQLRTLSTLRYERKQ